MPLLSLDFIRSRLALTSPPPAPDPGLAPAAVLVPLFEAGGELKVLFTQRTLTVKDHRGQVSFPGGVRDQEDPDLLATALRETSEEIGLAPEAAEVLGILPPVATITGYWIVPYVVAIPHPYDFHLNPREVERLFFLPLAGFCDPGRWSSGPYTYRGRETRVCCWRGEGTLVWGATARILLELLDRLGEHPLPGAREATCLD
jgi:8-oxo-dGTP pyrophosphatase MutT (NUDIX family)